ncbi:rhamnan synthesis F family protein [Sphingomonas sp. KR1UV-12]|uniref:Rhamnan synthesis F family protein n=1 Tax=Sphingomonas aurea TaxID=3063994 RepID=A0ABT9EPB6_9SPHN|nr:rhamnan synthesis F family protein [Sphingomonas sp. KR1UV-12]MDP1028791.1 rhamnan synthesis F family protein [Sphingomonas sp. KR1UV-12]
MAVVDLLPRWLYNRLRSGWRTALAPIRGRIRAEERDLAAQVPFGFANAVDAPVPRVAVVCHLFHADLAGACRAAIDNLPVPATLFLSTDSAAKVPAIARAFAGWPAERIEIRVLPNRGRDIAPKLVGFADVYADHDLILFLHTKKSLTAAIGDRWRSLLFASLCGSPTIVASILQVFRQHPDIGIVLPRHLPAIRGLLHWDGNFSTARSLARRMGFGIRRHHALDFPAGSMFWARPAALRPLLDLGLTLDDFPLEEDQVRGTVQHAIERLFLLAAEHAGYRWLKVAAPLPGDDDRTVRPIPDRTALDRFILDSRFPLLPQDRW